MVDLWPVIRSERLELIELLETLSAEQWAAPSLCAGWTVQDVAAHISWAPASTALQVVADLARAGFRPNKTNADSARRWSRRGTAAILEQLRKNAAGDAKPLAVPMPAVLVDAVVHGIDIRRPLGLSRTVPREAFVPAVEFCVGARWPGTMMLGGGAAKRVDGVRLTADDVDWIWGQGPEVHGSTESLLVLASGRPLRPGDLSGSGAEMVYARL